MERPVSIINFERCYLGAIAVGLVGSIVNWSHTQSMVQVQRAQQMIGTWYLPTILAMGIIVPLLLWYFAARRASSVAKWIIVVFFGFSCLGVLVGMAGHTYPPGLAGVLGIAAFVLNAIAVALLFKSDARVWFGEPPLEGEG
ncbi:MAG: hypothetical protein ACTHMG_06995 [Sphingomonas sp.]